ncbi:MAG: hypothetical protein KDK36_19370, partial [Leptospiraceae bacterium]|nr:hypothetical protein [Leptospiraceae bacterium]
KSISLSLIITFLFIQCYLHHTSIIEKPEGYDDKEVNLKEPIPLKVRFGETKYKDFVLIGYRPHANSGCAQWKKDLVRIDNECFRKIEVREKGNYFSNELISKLKSSNSLQFNSNSNLKIEINAFSDKEGDLRSESLWIILGTIIAIPIVVAYFNAIFPKGDVRNFFNGSVVLGAILINIIPPSDNNYAKYEIDLYDSKSNVKIKTFTYKTEHTKSRGFFNALYGVFFPMFSDSFDQSLNENTYTIARVVSNQFEKDFIQEMERNPELRKLAYINEPPTHIIQLNSKPGKENNSFNQFFITKLESKLQDKGLVFLSNKINTNSDRIITLEDAYFNEETNDFSYFLQCKDSKTKQIIWKEKGIRSIIKKDFDKDIDKIIDEIIFSLEEKAEL